MKTLLKSLFILIAALTTLSFSYAQVDENFLLNQFKKHVSILASDSLEGRETGTQGEKLAAGYIINEYKKTGLIPLGDDNSYLQVFEYTASKEYGAINDLKIGNKKFTIEKDDYYPLLYSANKSASGKLISVGYGISAPSLNYDDYKDLKDLEGKIFVMEFSSPDGMHPHSKYVDYSDIRAKLDKAIEKGALAVFFINSDTTADNPTNRSHIKITPCSVPVVFLNETAHELVEKNYGLKAKVSVEFKKVTNTGRNIVGYIDNKASSTVVIGAHYDHLGYGVEGSLYRGEEKQVHNGADDNASGTAILIELAGYYKNSNKKNNNYLFIAFSGEEKGLLGSNHFVKNPTTELEKVNYMLNADMVGRLDTSKWTLSIMGTGTSPIWDSVLNKISVDSLKIKSSKSGVSPSDNTSFYLKNIPSLHLFTGTHHDYHKPADDADKINYTGMVVIHKYICALIDELDVYGKLTFTKTKEDSSEKTPRFKVTLGVIPDYMFDGAGMRIDGTSDGKPAQKAGILAGDIVIQMGSHKVVDMMSYMKGLSKFNKGDKVIVKVKRGNELLEFEVIF